MPGIYSTTLYSLMMYSEYYANKYTWYNRLNHTHIYTVYVYPVTIHGIIKSSIAGRPTRNTSNDVVECLFLSLSYSPTFSVASIDVVSRSNDRWILITLFHRIE